VDTTIFNYCPVCEMKLENQLIPTEYLDVSHFFCSEQCRRLFENHPHLYIGLPGSGCAVKSRLKKVSRTNWLALKNPDKSSESLDAAFTPLMGVEHYELCSGRLIVAYDLLQVSLKEVADHLVNHDIQTSARWYHLLRLSYINYVEENERANLESQTPKGCH